jgi:CubicO group peptidase (beta-lactamase class C family)
MFRHIPAGTALLCAGLVLSPGAQAQTVHEPTFRVAIDRWMDDRVKGYAFVIADKDGIVAEAAGGWAQAPGDGNLRMSTTIPAGFGSNQKVLSGNALLDLLEDRSSLSVAQELKTPIRFFVPDRWIQAYFNAPSHETLNAIRLRDLLDHTSALPQESDGGAHGTRIARALSEGADAGDFANNKREYNNHNYTLLLYTASALSLGSRTPALAGSPGRTRNRKKLKVMTTRMVTTDQAIFLASSRIALFG